jgi:hypothetical protein
MIKKVSILSSAGTVSRARLHRLANTLIQSGIEVHIWAPGTISDAPKGSHFHKVIGGKSKVIRVFRSLALPLQAKGDAYLTISPDILPITFIVAKLRRKKVIADINEDYVKLLEDRTWATGIVGTIAKSVARLASAFAARADLLIVADVQVPPFNAKNRLVIKNLPDSSMIPDSGELDKSPRAIYIGDIRKSRGLYSMLRIAELSPKWNFDFIGPIANEDKHYVDQWMKNSDVATRVTFHGALAPNKSWEYAKGAWVGLTLLEATPAFIEAVPSKLYEYSYAGLAVLSSSLPRCIELLNQSGGGVITQSDEGAASILNSWAQNQDALLNMRRKSKLWAREILNPDAHYQAFTQAVAKL